MQLSFLEITHANNGKKLFIVPSHVYAVYLGEDKSTHVVSHSGTWLPARESVEEVKQALSKALQEEVKNG